ncbi:Putative nuclease HARBI1 [Cyphomyrmex costatus]|uniref:Putative nuclease HARBI1 n=1 Tax=Cyphomyrmex costatus TaxID=456900 RepID=A0A151IID6_9HYME|nr:Putative nuclease HARBI1 [Cyphomyrmex costatus]
MQAEDNEKYIEYFRLPPQLFHELLKLVGSVITKEHVVRDPISPVEIVSETCEAIWNCLKETVFLTEMKTVRQSVADEFERLWNFSNCIGGIDGKHVMIQVSANSGSTYYNYKGHHNTNLLEISDASYCFTIVDIGAEGRQSDRGIFRNSEIGRRFEANSFKLPKPKEVEIGGPTLPYVLIADEAFPLSTYMMRPYPRSGKLDHAYYACGERAEIFCTHKALERTTESTIKDMKEAYKNRNERTKKKYIKDVKGPTISLQLHFFNMISRFVPNYMHCILLFDFMWSYFLIPLVKDSGKI